MSEMSAAEAAIVARFDAAEPAPESWRGDDGLRDALAEALRVAWAQWEDEEVEPDTAEGWRVQSADALLPVVTAWHAEQVAALRAKAAAADRVRDEVDALSRETGAFEAGYKGWALKVVSAVRRALDGPPC